MGVTGFNDLDAAGVRGAVGLASANLDTQIGTLATAANLATVAGYLDTEIAAILADTNELQTDWANGGRLDLMYDYTVLLLPHIYDDADLVSHTQDLALRLAQLPAHAAVEIRQAYDHSEQASLVEQLHYEASRQRDLIDRPEFKEGVRAFLEKREPQFPAR